MDTKQLRSIIKEEVTGVVKTQLESVKNDLENIHDGLEVVKRDVKELRGDMDGVKRDVKELSEDVGILKKDVKELSENVDAARGDIEHLHMDVKGIREKEGLFHSRNKREIDEIKTRLGLPLMPDNPAV